MAEKKFLKFFNRSTQSMHHDRDLDRNLEELHSHLGLTQQTPDMVTDQEPTVTGPTQNYARVILYAPDMDGQSEAGEVIWAPLKQEKEDATERQPLLVVGRNGHTLLCLYISSDPKHDSEENWISIGIGPWEKNGGPGWLRTDTIVEVPESDIQRRGAVIPPKRYERLAPILRGQYGWS